MIIYKDIISGDELVTDTYKLKLIDDIVFEVQGKTVTEKSEIDDSLIGGNKSAEAVCDEDFDPSVTTGINVVLAHRLVETGFTKKQYQKHIKEYMKGIAEKLSEEKPERVAVFKKNVQKFVVDVLKEFDEYQFFLGESLAEGGMVILMKYPEGCSSPCLYFFKDGLVEEKV